MARLPMNRPGWKRRLNMQQTRSRLRLNPIGLSITPDIKIGKSAMPSMINKTGMTHNNRFNGGRVYGNKTSNLTRGI